MIDIHCHVLPGVDDGAKNIEDSIDICRFAAGQGIKTIVATPHHIDGETETEQSKIMSHLLLLNNELKSEDINLVVLPGMEVYITSNLSQLYDRGRVMTLNCKNYMLIEFPLYNGLPSCLDDVLFNLQIKKIKPIIAHPERSNAIMEHPNIIYKWVEKGILVQVNSGSIEGLFGKSIKKTADMLLEHNLVHIVASDNHSCSGRMSSMKKSYDIVAKRYGESKARELYYDNPYCVVNGRSIDVDEPLPVKKKRFFII